jgi:AAA ATPase domain
MEARAGAVLVGRGRELGELERALDAARAGSGTTVLVAGEAGIGKTRLASELAARARGSEFEVLLGRSIDLVGTELPYQPFVEALRPLGAFRQVDGPAAASQLRVFEETLALLSERAAAVPVLLVLEDVHWADTSTLDLVVFLAHNLNDRRVVVLATYRADEPSSAERMRRLTDSVRRSGSALLLELGPLEREELAALLAARADTPLPVPLTDAIVARSEGNLFFAEELLAVAGDRSGELPRGLRDLLLQRVTRLDPPTQSLLRLAAAAGRDVGYPLLRGVAGLPERDLRQSLRRAVEHGVLVAEQATGCFRFRHALLAGGGLRDDPARRAGGAARAAGRGVGAQRGRGAGGAGAPLGGGGSQGGGAGRLGRGGASGGGGLWPGGGAGAPGAGAGVVARGAGRGRAGEARPRRLVLLGGAAGQRHGCGATGGRARGASDRAGRRRRPAALLHENLARYLHHSGRGDAALAELERAVELVPAKPPSAGRAQALAALAHGLSLAWRYDEALAICERALALARAVGAQRVELSALLVLGSDLPTSAAVTRGSRSSGGPCGSRRRAPIPTRCMEPTSRSPTC